VSIIPPVATLANDVSEPTKPENIMKTKQLATTEPDDTADGFMTTLEAAKRLAVSRSKVYLMLNQGLLPQARFGSSVRIPRRAVEQYIQKCLIPASA